MVKKSRLGEKNSETALPFSFFIYLCTRKSLNIKLYARLYRFFERQRV